MIDLDHLTPGELAQLPDGMVTRLMELGLSLDVAELEAWLDDHGVALSRRKDHVRYIADGDTFCTLYNDTPPYVIAMRLALVIFAYLDRPATGAIHDEAARYRAAGIDPQLSYHMARHDRRR